MRHSILIASISAIAAVSAANISFATTTTNDFSSGVGSGWSVDRYAPQVFDTVSFGGNDRLRLGLRTSGNLANRPSPYDNSFYNYQGMGQSITSAPTGSSISVDMYVDASWQNGARAGIWGVLSNSAGISGYPIIEYTKGTNTDGSIGAGNFSGFRYWDDTNGWVEQSTSIATNAWYRMTIGLTNSLATYSISDAAGVLVANYAVSNLGSTSFSGLILQGGNKGPAGDYDIMYDNLTVAVPAPGVAALIGLAGAFGGRRRRN